VSEKFYAFLREATNLGSTLDKTFALKSMPAKSSSSRGQVQFLDQVSATIEMDLAKNALNGDRLCRHRLIFKGSARCVVLFAKNNGIILPQYCE